MYDFYYTDWQLDSYKGVNDPCMNWSDSPFLVSTNLGTLQNVLIYPQQQELSSGAFFPLKRTGGTPESCDF